MTKTANIINFVRSVEPRTDDDSYLLPTLKKELELCGRFGFRSTVLLQFDALIKEEYRELVARYADKVELGLWLEVVGPLADLAGIEWSGRYVWDWEGGCNYLTFYSEDERKKLLDAAFGKYREYYGEYPAVVGAWILDSVSLAHMKEKYGISAACICRDQYGTDYTTLWGGYYNGAYFPSVNNVVCPANTKEKQIDVPVFRMLGPDPIYQYDLGLGDPERAQSVHTLEPVYPLCGGSPDWVKWYLKENYNDKALSLAYAQFGQENSFGADQIFPALETQFELLSERLKEGDIELLTLGEAGRKYSAEHELTAPAAMCTDSDWKGNGYRSVWYYSRFYRVNILYKDKTAWIRDFQLYDEDFSGSHVAKRNGSINTGCFDLPVIDGFRFSKDGIRAGIYVKLGDGLYETDTPFISEAVGDDTIKASLGELRFSLAPETLEIYLPEGARLEFVCADLPYIPYRYADEKELHMAFSGFGTEEYAYSLHVSQGRFVFGQDRKEVLPENGRIVFAAAKKA